MEALWRYDDMGHQIRLCDVGIGLGSHDPGVAVVAARLFHAGLFPRAGLHRCQCADHHRAVPARRGRPLPGVRDRERCAGGVDFSGAACDQHGAEPELSRRLLAEHGIPASSVLLMSRPHQQRRAYATCRKVWPEVDVVCASNPLSLDAYVESIGDARKVIDMLIGDTQRIEVYAECGFAIPQRLPDDVHAAFERLVAAGFTSRSI